MSSGGCCGGIAQATRGLRQIRSRGYFAGRGGGARKQPAGLRRLRCKTRQAGRRGTCRHGHGSENIQFDSQHEHLPPRCYNWRSEDPDERRLPRQYRRVLVARARLARAQSHAGRWERSAAMTLFLASVTGAEEAQVALAHGADIVDLKDPAKGALGALSEETVQAAVAGIAGKRPVSAVIGDLPMQVEAIVGAASAMADTGVDFIKVGLFPEPGREACIRVLHALAATTKIIGVMFADLTPDPALIRTMADAGFAGAMLDTAGKGGGRLLDHMDIPALREFVAACRSHGLLAGLAGSLETPDVPRVLLRQPDVLGFRTALCVGRVRTAPIEATAVDVVRELIPLDERSRSEEHTSEL